MRILLAKIFRLLFKVPFFQKRFFGIHKRIFSPLNLFKGVVQVIKFKKEIYLELHVDDWIQENIYFLGKYEEAELLFIQSSLQKGDVFIDIGTNIGLHSLFSSKLVGEKGIVVSFEPFSKNFTAFKKNILLNKSLNIIPENIAISNTEKSIEIFYNSEESNLGMASSYLTEHSDSETIKAVSLDSYLRDNPLQKINFIKIDIEGGEYNALLGMKNTLTTFYPTLLIEMLENNEVNQPNNNENITNYLEKIGYKKYYINNDGSLELDEINKDRMNFAFVKKSIK